MNPDDWRRAKAVIGSALARDPRERAAYLATACPDPVMRDEIAALIERCESNPSLASDGLPDADTAGDAATVPRISGDCHFTSGQQIGPYVFESLLGKGGMGEVYLANDTRLHRRVAIKVLSGPGGDAAEVRRLTREAGAAAQLNDPRIAAVFDVLEADGRAFIVMEYVPGRTLAEQARERPLDPPSVARIGAEIAAGLAHAHKAGIVHCDLKPANIRITPDGAIKILDFGLARPSVRPDGISSPIGAASFVSGGLVVAGTPGYMSPEQMIAHPLDPRTDIYSLGVILFELVAGRRPYHGRDMMSLALAVMTQPVPPLPNPAATALRPVIERCLEKDPAQRYQSADEVAEALRRIISGASTVAVIAPRAMSLRRATSFAVGAALLVALVGALVWRARSTAPAQPHVVAILPFTAADGATSTPLATGLADILASDLSGVPGFVLIPRGASLKYAADAAGYRAVAADLGADRALIGSISETLASIDATISLVKVPAHAVLWSQRFSGPREDIIGLERQIAETSIAQLRVNPPRGAVAVVRTPRPTLDRQAFEDYSQARTFLDRSDDPANLQRALTLFQSATARDRHFALAFAGMGEAYSRLYSLTHDPAAADHARDAALEALRLDPAQPMVRYALASTYRAAGKQPEAIEELTRAIELQPSNDEFHIALGLIYGDLHRTDDAVAELTIAKGLRPGYWNTYRALGLVNYQAGRYPEAIAALTRATELQPDSNSGFQMLGTAYHAAGDLDRALESYTRANAIKPSPFAWSNIGMLRHQQHRFADAVAAYKQSLALRPREPNTYRNLADAYARIPDPANARDAYQRAIDLASEQLKVNPTSAPLLALQAICDAKLGRFAIAEALASRAVALAPASGDVWFKQAAVEALSNRPDAAAAALASAIAHGFSRDIARDDEDIAKLRSRPDVAAMLK